MDVVYAGRRRSPGTHCRPEAVGRDLFEDLARLKLSDPGSRGEGLTAAILLVVERILVGLGLVLVQKRVLSELLGGWG